MTLKQLLDTLAEVESRIAVMYERLAAEFRGVADVSDLWDSMSREEVHHADLLTRAAATAADRPAATLMLDRLQKMQELMAQFERDQQKVVSLQQALEFTANVEEAEAEYVHGALGTDASVSALAQDPAMGHRLHGLLEHAIELFGTPALRQRLAWRRFRP